MKKFLVISILLTISACSMVPKVDGDKEWKNSDFSTIPYATENELESLTNQDSVFYWRASRAFALITLQDFSSLNKWYGAKLSEKPVVVYDINGKPMYYEWIVIVDNTPVGTITGNARKKEGSPIHYVLNYVRDYGSVSKNVNSKVISKGYPRVTFDNFTTKSDEVSDTINEDFEEDITLEYILNNPEKFTNENITIDMVVRKVNEIISSNEQIYREMEEIMSNLVYVSTNDDELKEFFDEVLNQSGTKSLKTHSRYYGTIAGSTEKWNTRWWYFYKENDTTTLFYKLGWYLDRYGLGLRLWCGPTAAGIYLTYYGRTNKIVSYIYTNYSNGVSNVCTNFGFKKLGEEMGIIGNEWYIDNGGVTTYSEVINGLRWATDNGMSFDYYNASDWWFGDGSWWANAFGQTTYDRIKQLVNKDDIAISGRSGYDKNKSGHWRVAIGYKQNDIYNTVDVYGLKFVGWWFIIPIFEWTKVGTRQEFVRTDKYILITDNGYETSGGYGVDKRIEGLPIYWEYVNSKPFSYHYLIYKK